MINRAFYCCLGVHAHAYATFPQGIEGVLDQLETDLSADTDGEPSELAEVPLGYIHHNTRAGTNVLMPMSTLISSSVAELISALDSALVIVVDM